MEHKNYVVKKQARFTGIGGDVNIPYGTHLEAQNGCLLWDGKPVCAANSQNGLDHFAQNDDGRGEERGRLTTEIISTLIKRNKNYQARWDKVWADERIRGQPCLYSYAHKRLLCDRYRGRGAGYRHPEHAVSYPRQGGASGRSCDCDDCED